MAHIERETTYPCGLRTKARASALWQRVEMPFEPCPLHGEACAKRGAA